MNLLETTIETTLTGAPAWVETLIALVLGLIGPKLAKYGVAVVKKPAAKAAAASAGAIALAVMLTGCGLFKSTDKSWIEADRATYDLIAPEYGAYVDADTKLAQFQKDMRKSAIETWRIRLEANEKAAK